MTLSPQLGRPAPQAASPRNLCALRVSALDSSPLGLTFNFQLSTFNRVFLLRVLCGENSSSFRSSLIPRHSPLTTKSFTIRTSMTPLPQLLYNPHLRAPLGSAGNKGLITPLESALTKNSPVTSLESALTKNLGVGVWLTRHATKHVCPERPSRAEGPAFSSFPTRKCVLGRIATMEHSDLVGKDLSSNPEWGLMEPRWRAAKPGYPSVPLQWAIVGATIGHSQAQALAMRETSPLLPVSKIRERTWFLVTAKRSTGIARRCPRLAIYPDLVGAVPGRAGRPAHQHRVGKAGSVRLG